MKEKRKPKSSGFMAALKEEQEAMRPFWEKRHAIEAKECPSRRARFPVLHLSIDTEGGNCPVQIEGHVKGKPFYFRARGDHWSLGIGGEPVGSPEWYYEEPYGTWPDAGWMHLHEAYDFLIKAVCLWRPSLASAMSAGTAETEGLGAESASTVRDSGDAQTQPEEHP